MAPRMFCTAEAPDAAAVAELRAALLDLLDRLDRLGLSQAGAHLDMAIHCLEPEQPCPFLFETAGNA